MLFRSDVIPEHLFCKFIAEYGNWLVIVDIVLSETTPHFDLVVILDEVVGIGEDSETVCSSSYIWFNNVYLHSS